VGKCCCGCCLLQTGATVALVLSSIESLCGLLINIELLLVISNKSIFNPTELVINVDKIEDFEAFHGIVLAGIGLNILWFLFGLFATTGNITQSHGRLKPWVIVTYLITLFHFGLTIYFGIKFQSSFGESPKFYIYDDVPTQTLTYLTLLCIYSGGGVFVFLNFYLAHVVEMRGKEIDQDYGALMMYLLSHINQCTQVNEDMRQNLLPAPPPSYSTTCPPYLPQEIYQRTQGSDGSNWSLSYDAFKALSTGEIVPTTNTSCAAGNISTRVFVESNAPSYMPEHFDTSDTSILP